MMDMHTRNQYLKEVRLEYLKAPKKQKTRLLDEAVKRTRLDRKGLIKKLKPKSNLDRVEIIRRSRTATYGHETVAALARCFEIFDYGTVAEYASEDMLSKFERDEAEKTQE